MLGVILTIWLLLQLPAALALGRFIGCSGKSAGKRTEARKPSPVSRPARAA
jgi:hypothetical protein